MKFCTSCGKERQPEWVFCAHCGQSFASPAGTRDARRRPSPLAGIAVFAVLALVGAGVWVSILSPKERQGPPGSPQDPPAAGSLPPNHPPLGEVPIPDDVKSFIANLKADAESRPDDAAVWEQLAEVQYRAARVNHDYYAQALSSYEHLLEIAPQNLKAVRGIANVHYDLGHYDQAQPFFERFLAKQPSDPTARTDLATVHLHLGDVDKAVREYEQIIRDNPSFVQAQYNLGVALHRRGDVAGALSAFRKAQELAGDENVRARIAFAIAQLESTSDDGEGAHADDAAGTAFQQRVESIFRQHEIVGPRVVSIDWPEPTRVKVALRDFPMDSMPPFVRTKFTTRIQEGIRDAKQLSDAPAGIVEIAIVDASTQATMETVREEE